MSLALSLEPPTLRRLPVELPDDSQVRLRVETIPSPSPAPSVGAWRDVHKRIERRAACLARHPGRVAQLGVDLVRVLHALQELWAAVLWDGNGELDEASPLARLVDEVHGWACLVLEEFEELVARTEDGEDAWDVAGRAFTEELLLRVLAGVEPAREAVVRARPALPESGYLRDAVAALHRNLRASA